VVVFQSGFAANAGTVSAILGRDDVIVSDALNHASIIDGARLSRAAIKVFPHKDVDAARKILRELPASQRKLLITDGVFSMDGDLGALPGLCDLAEDFGCIMMVDDAHASGVFGRNGRGTVDTSACTAAWTCRWARCRRRSARSAATSRDARVPHTGDCGRRRAGDAALGPAVRGGRLRAGYRLPHCRPRQRPASAPSSPPRTRAISSSSRSARSARSGESLD
jgi:hypothetical protein